MILRIFYHSFTRFFLLFFLLVLCSCRKDVVIEESSSVITLKWNQSYDSGTLNEAKQGLHWALSRLGAKYTDASVVEADAFHLRLSVDQLGLKPQAIVQLSYLQQKIKGSEAYLKVGSIDLGRYVALIIGASEHYYKIVGMPKKLEDLVVMYTLSESAGFVNESSVSPKDRLIRFSNQQKFNQLFIAEELDKTTGELLEIEVFDLMDNGQLRFGIYDTNGNLIPAADPNKSNAGKPAKCMWCHESKILPIFATQNDYPNFLTYLELKDTLDYFSESHILQQGMLFGGIDFSDLVVHEEMELLYISFMEPSLQRLANEWNLSEPEVLEKLAGIETHQHSEFEFLGDLYFRSEVEKFAPFKSLTTSSSMREESDLEVNYLD